MPTSTFRTARRRLKVAAIIALISSSATISSCTEPAVALKEPASQQSASNLRDWQATADRVVLSMEEKGVIPVAGHPARPGGMPYPGPYYVHVMAQGSTFLEEVRQAIEQDLMKRGVSIARSPAGATVINLDIDVVHWGAEHPYPGGALTAAGLAGAVGAGLSAATPLGAAGGAIVAVGAGLVADVGIAAYPMTDTEAVWHASIITADRVTVMTGETLYIESGDIPLYRGTVTIAAISSPGVSMFASTRPLHYAP